MKKFLTKSLFAVAFACLLLSSASIAACGSNEIAKVNSRWNTGLPTSMTVEYSYENVGWFGDGVYYYVCGVTKDELQVSFVTDEGQTEEVISYNAALLVNIDERYSVDCGHGFDYYAKSDENGDNLYLLYDNDLNKLIILEIHT